MQLDRYTGRRQQLGVPGAVVAQRVVAGDGDVGGRQAGQVGRPAGGQARRWIGEVERDDDGRTARDARPLDEHLDPLPRYFDPYHLEDMRFLWYRTTVLPANWKAALDDDTPGRPCVLARSTECVGVCSASRSG